MKFMSILLKEGRKEDLQKKYANKFSEEDLNWILNISDLQDFNHKYTDFILKTVHPDHVTGDTEIGVNLIKSFDKYQSQLDKKDINQYKSLEELDSALIPIHQKEKQKDLESRVDKIYEDDKFLVVKPKTEESSCKYGSNTKWCVTSKGTGHFGRYTSGRQALYFIINKSKSTNKNYSKVAIHFDDEGNKKYWDTQDTQMSHRETEIFDYAFPEIIQSINNDYKSFALSMVDRVLTQVFDSIGETSSDDRKYLGTQNTLSVNLRGFQNNTELGFGHSEGLLDISLDSVEGTKSIDRYLVLITYKPENENTFTANIGFEGRDTFDNSFEDLDLDRWEIDVRYKIDRNPAQTAEGVRRHIATRVLDHIKNNPKLVQKVAGSTRVWRADRANYGYTFGKNKGLIKKLVDYLDSGVIGNKLDFLEHIGKLKSKIVNGKKMYAHSSRGDYSPSSQFRGQFSSFFASAKNAGILNYRKIGNQFLLIKGPNFNAFKEGKLKAL